MPVKLQYIQFITDKTVTTDLSSGEITILLSVTQMEKIQNSLPFRKVRKKLPNRDVTKEALKKNCTHLKKRQ